MNVRLNLFMDYAMYFQFYLVCLKGHNYAYVCVFQESFGVTVNSVKFTLKTFVRDLLTPAMTLVEIHLKSHF